jgi:hypothetical protein
MHITGADLRAEQTTRLDRRGELGILRRIAEAHRLALVLEPAHQRMRRLERRRRAFGTVQQPERARGILAEVDRDVRGVEDLAHQ